MTAYRYVRTGRLRARRSGGVWLVNPADVDAFTAGRRPGAGTSSEPLTAARLEHLLLCGDDLGALGLVTEALASWASVVDVHTRLLGPALRSIGDRWADGELSVADEHQATAAALRVLGHLGPVFVPPGRHRGTVVVGVVGGDRHALPAAMAADLVRHAGFTVVELGGDTPPTAFADAAAEADRLVAVAIGATLPGQEAELRQTVAAVRAVSPAAWVVVGGAGAPEDPATVGADQVTHGDARSLVDAVTEAESRGRPAAGRGGGPAGR